MSRVIKNRDGVTVVEGTPAASLVKDGEKFFDSKPPERMAGESIGQPRKIEEDAFMERLNKDRLAGIQRTPEEEVALRDEMFKTKDPLPRDTVYRDLEDSPMRPSPERRERRDTIYREGESPLRRRNEAKDKAEFRRVRSKKEAERSQEEQKATKGKFITTLGR